MSVFLNLPFDCNNGHQEFIGQIKLDCLISILKLLKLILFIWDSPPTQGIRKSAASRLVIELIE